MAEETNTGTAPVAVPVTELTAPVTPQTPQETEPQPTTPVGGGPSLEQLREELAEKERLIQDASERASRAEHEAMLTRNLVEQLNLRGRVEEPAPAVTDDEFLTNPAKATGKIIEGYFERERKERERERVGRYVETARSSYERGKQEAMKANPELYRGIDGDISREILNNIQSSLKAGQPVDAAVLSNPRYWEAAALAMRVMNGEDVSKYYRRREPMSASHNETPSVSTPPQAGTSLTPQEIAMAQFLGGTPEQFAAAKAKGK